MIVTDHRDQLVTVTVFGEFTLADYREFEELADYKVKFGGVVDLLFDLRQMAGATLDVAWEELRFSRAHAHDFRRVAVLSDSQWVAWSAWLTQLSVDADVRLFGDEAEARDWLAAGGDGA